MFRCLSKLPCVTSIVGWLLRARVLVCVCVCVCVLVRVIVCVCVFQQKYGPQCVDCSKHTFCCMCVCVCVSNENMANTVCRLLRICIYSVPAMLPKVHPQPWHGTKALCLQPWQTHIHTHIHTYTHTHAQRTCNAPNDTPRHHLIQRPWRHNVLPAMTSHIHTYIHTHIINNVSTMLPVAPQGNQSPYTKALETQRVSSHDKCISTHTYIHTHIHNVPAMLPIISPGIILYKGPNDTMFPLEYIHTYTHTYITHLQCSQ